MLALFVPCIKDVSMENSNEKSKDIDTKSSGGQVACAVKCPMCNFEHKQIRLNPRMFWNQGMAIDRQPIQYQCLSGLGAIHPPLYELWHCPACHYTAHNRVFPNPLKNVFVEKGLLPRKYAEARREPAFHKVCDVLGGGLEPGDVDFVSAIRIALLAIHCNLFFVEILRQGHSTLARDSLRLGWFYRDWKNMTAEAQREKDDAALQDLFDQVGDAWPTLPRTETHALEAACAQFEISLDENSVANDAMERIIIQQHTGRVYLQIGEIDPALAWLQRCRKDALDEETANQRILREDERTKAMSEEDRAKLISLTRRYRQILDETHDLVEMIQKRRKQAARASHSQAPQASANTPRKAGFLKGLFKS